MFSFDFSEGLLSKSLVSLDVNSQSTKRLARVTAALTERARTVLGTSLIVGSMKTVHSSEHTKKNPSNDR